MSKAADVLLLITLALGVTVAVISCVAPEKELPLVETSYQSYGEKLQEFYGSTDEQVNMDIVFLSADYIKEAATYLCVEDQTDTMLAMWHRESRFNPAADDTHIAGRRKRSLGITQTRHDYVKRLRKSWSKLGVTLGPFSDVRTQIFLGVMEFRDHLESAHGDVKEAVRRYNGGALGGRGLRMAKAYARNVMVSREKIFGRAYTAGEKTSLYKECHK